MLFLCSWIVSVFGTHDPWSLRTFNSSDVVDVGLSYLEDLITSPGKSFDKTVQTILSFRHPDRHGIAAIVHLFQGSEKVAAETAIEGYLYQECTLCASLLGFLTATGFFRGVGGDGLQSELIQDYQLRFPVTTSKDHEERSAMWLYKEALEFGSTDPLALLGFLNANDESLVCLDLIDGISELADSSVENAVSALPRPRRVRSREDMLRFVPTREREEKLLNIIASGELMVGPDEGEESAFALHVPAMLEELRHRIPEPEHSRVFKALTKYLQDGKTTGRAIEAVRDLLDLIKRNAVIKVYNVALEERKEFCVDSMRIFRRIITQHNRFTRLLFSLSAVLAERGDMRRAYLAQLMLGELYAPALLNAIDLTRNETPIPESWKPTDFLEITSARIANCSGKQLHLTRNDDSRISCESLCLRNRECKFILQSNQHVLDCKFFAACPEANDALPAKDGDRELTEFMSAAYSLLRRTAEKDGSTVFFSNEGFRTVLLKKAAQREDIPSGIEALLRLGKQAKKEGLLREAKDFFKDAVHVSEEARFEMALLEFETFDGHVAEESRALDNLFDLIFLPTADPYERADEVFDKAFEEEWGVLLMSDLGDEVLRSLDVEFPSKEPSSNARRLASAAAYFHRRFIRHYSRQTLTALVVSVIAAIVASLFWIHRVDTFNGKLVSALDYAGGVAVCTETSISFRSFRCPQDVKFRTSDLDASLNAESITDMNITRDMFFVYVDPGLLLVFEATSDSVSSSSLESDCWSLELTQIVRLPFKRAQVAVKGETVIVKDDWSFTSLGLNIGSIEEEPQSYANECLSVSSSSTGCVIAWDNKVEISLASGDFATFPEAPGCRFVSQPSIHGTPTSVAMIVDADICILACGIETYRFPNLLKDIQCIALVEDLIVYLSRRCLVLTRAPDFDIPLFRLELEWDCEKMFVTKSGLFIQTSSPKYLILSLSREGDNCVIETERIVALDGSECIASDGCSVRSASTSEKAIVWTDEEGVYGVVHGQAIKHEIRNAYEVYLTRDSTSFLVRACDSLYLYDSTRVLCTVHVPCNRLTRVGRDVFVARSFDSFSMILVSNGSIAVGACFAPLPCTQSYFASDSGWFFYGSNPMVIDSSLGFLVELEHQCVKMRPLQTQNECEFSDVAHLAILSEFSAPTGVVKLVESCGGRATFLVIDGRTFTQCLIDPPLCRYLASRGSLSELDEGVVVETVCRLVQSLEGERRDFSLLRLVQQQLEPKIYLAAVIAGIRSACPLSMYPIASALIGQELDDAWVACLGNGWLETASQLLLIIQDSVGPQVVRQVHAKQLTLAALDQGKFELVEEVVHFIHPEVSVFADLLREVLAYPQWTFFTILCRAWMRIPGAAPPQVGALLEEAKSSLLSFVTDLPPTAVSTLHEALKYCGLEAHKASF